MSLTCWSRGCLRTNRGSVGRRLLWGEVTVGEGRRSLGLRCLLSQESRWRACLGNGGCPNFELRSKFTRLAASADRAPLKTRHRRVFLTLRALSGSNPPPSASTWRQGASLGNYSIIGNSMKKKWRREGDSNVGFRQQPLGLMASRVRAAASAGRCFSRSRPLGGSNPAPY